MNAPPTKVVRLRLLADDTAHLAAALRRHVSEPDKDDTCTMQTASDMVALAKQMLGQGRNLANFINGDLLADPARHMLLDLYVCEARQRPVSVSEACIAADVPATTALRWIKRLEDEGLVVRRSSETDHRRILVSLTHQGWAQITAYLEEELRKRNR